MKRWAILSTLVVILIMPSGHGGAVAAAGDVHSLRLPDKAMGPAAVLPTLDWPISPAGADTRAFRINHWWPYDKLGMLGGYYEGGIAFGNGGKDQIGFVWQASVYPSTAKAYQAWQDGLNRTEQWAMEYECKRDVGVDCGYVEYDTVSGGTHGYISMVVDQCVGETKAVSTSSKTFSRYANAIWKAQIGMIRAGVAIFKRVCVAGFTLPQGPRTAPATATPLPAPTPPPTPSPTAGPPPIQPGFTGSCFSFRGQLWSVAQSTSKLLVEWWADLQKSYGQYPVPDGGSVPGATQAQYDTAGEYMAAIQRRIWNKRASTGLAVIVERAAEAHGIKDPRKSGPANWAVLSLLNTLLDLRRAAGEEWHDINSGLDDYHLAQKEMGWAWQALRQLPCRG